jgi:hypothetical protein
MRVRTSLWPALVLLALTLPAMPASAQEKGEQAWLAVLRLQLRDNNHCQLEKVIFSREIELGNETGLEGRIRCFDGREYDFTRQRAHEKFDIRLCQPAVC